MLSTALREKIVEDFSILYAIFTLYNIYVYKLYRRDTLIECSALGLLKIENYDPGF